GRCDGRFCFSRIRRIKKCDRQTFSSAGRLEGDFVGVGICMTAPFAFTLPPELSAKEPPERRGIRRDQVRLLVIERATGRIEHTRFDKIGNHLRAGDLLVFNSSRTLPASLRGCECSATHGPCMEVRLAEHLPDDSWLALLVCEQGDPFGCGLRAGMEIEFAEGLAATVLERTATITRRWRLR